MIRRPPRSTQSRSSAASDVYKRQAHPCAAATLFPRSVTGPASPPNSRSPTHMTVRAVVVGSLVMDLSFRVPHRPEPRTVVIADDFGTFRGGKGYNQAIALARLGARVTMIGAVGADAHGDAFIDALERDVAVRK